MWSSASAALTCLPRRPITTASSASKSRCSEARGRVIGSLSAKQVRLYGTAYVDGDITHEQLSIDVGAYFQGRCLQGRKQESQPAPVGFQPAPQHINAPAPAPAPMPQPAPMAHALPVMIPDGTARIL